jgi:hypothetical protein
MIRKLFLLMLLLLPPIPGTDITERASLDKSTSFGQHRTCVANRNWGKRANEYFMFNLIINNGKSYLGPSVLGHFSKALSSPSDSEMVRHQKPPTIHLSTLHGSFFNSIKTDMSTSLPLCRDDATTLGRDHRTSWTIKINDGWNCPSIFAIKRLQCAPTKQKEKKARGEKTF